MAVLPALCVPAFAHGGSYRGPAGEVPPDSRTPSDPPPPPEGGPPGTPGGNDPPGGPTTNGGTGVGPTTGEGGGAPPGGTGGGAPPPAGGPGGGGVGTGGGKRGGGGGGVGFEDWRFWWSHNESEILSLRSALDARRGPGTGSGAHAIGQGGGSGSRVRLATEAAIATQVVPLLREILADPEQHFDVRSAAAIALAKIGDAASVSEVRDLLRNADGKAHRVVVESAALALGLFERDDASVREGLLEAVADRSRSGSFARPFSAVSLGFQPAHGDAAIAVRSALLGVVSGRESGEDVKPACLLALGLTGDGAAIPALLGVVKTGRGPADRAAKLNDLEISHAVQALGRIGRAGTAAGDTSVADALLAIAAKGAGDGPHTARSAVIALGRVAPGAPAPVLGRAVSALVGIAMDADDAQSRTFALIALGRIGADARTSDAARRDCVAALGRVLDKERPANLVQPYAAIALGLVGRSSVVAGRSADEETIRKPIRDKLAASKDASTRSAFALAAGLAGDGRAADLLLPLLEDHRSNKALRGYAALALGLIGDSRAVEPVRAAVLESPDRELTLHSAVAAGLLGDPRAVDDLVAVLKDADRSQYVLGSVAVALGAIGDERAIPPLCAIVRDAKTFPDLTRALAVVALGRIGDRRALPTLARLASDFNYRAYVPATRELLTIL